MKLVGQNDDDYEKFAITREEFEAYVERNRALVGGHPVKLVPEPVELIEGSYVMVNPDGRFYASMGGRASYSSSIFEVGVEKAYNELKYYPERFFARNGYYDAISL